MATKTAVKVKDTVKESVEGKVWLKIFLFLVMCVNRSYKTKGNIILRSKKIFNF